MSENSGIIRKKKSKFSMISNTLALDPTISAKAKGIYLIICAELNKVNYTVYKSTIQASCRDGEASFESGWKELKDAGYLIQTKSKGKDGKWIYEYEILDEPVKKEIDPESTEKPDPENRGVDIVSPHPENPGVENPGLENMGVYNIPEKRNTRERNISSSSSKDSINTPSVEVKPNPLSDDDEKELENITWTLFRKREGKRLSTLPLKYGCDGNMIFPALKIALENGALNLIGYVATLFKDWKENGIKHLADLGVSGVSSREEIEEEIALYKGQLESDNEKAKELKPGYPDEAYEFGFFSDRSDEYRALAKIFPPKDFFCKIRDYVIKGLPVNDAIEMYVYYHGTY